MPHDDVERLTEAIADRKPVDWDAERVRGTDEESKLLGLQLIETISKIYASENAPKDHPVRWGPLEIVEFVAEGTFGDVYRARDPRLDRPIALKLLRAADEDGPWQSEIVEEARLMARLRHPNVVAVYGADRIDGRTGVWMELIDGPTLEHQVTTRGPLPTSEALQAGIELCRALDAVHSAGLLHRDVKTRNVLRRPDGSMALTDFGTGRELQPALAHFDRTGTPLYLAPEIFAGDPASEQSDIYSLGVVLYRLLTMQYPVAGDSLAEIEAVHKRREPVSLGRSRPDLPLALVRAVDRALAPDPSARYGSAREMERSLDALSVKHRLARLPSAKAAAALLVTGLAMAVLRSQRASLVRENAAPPPARESVPIAGPPAGGDGRSGTALRVAQSAVMASPFVSVVPQSRVQDVLHLMRKPPDVVLDGDLAREVALRDGAIDLVVSVEPQTPWGATVVAASVMDPRTGRFAPVIKEVVHDANDHSEALSLTKQLQAALRQLHERPHPALDPMERITTASTEAARTYSRAYALGNQRLWPAARRIAEDAVRLDPDLAVAHTWLAWAIRNNQGRPSDYREQAELGMRLAADSSAWEKHWTAGSAYFLAGRFREAIMEFEELRKVRPQFPWTDGNIQQASARLGRSSTLEAQQMLTSTRQAAQLKPGDVDANWSAASVLLRFGLRSDELREYAHRIRTVSLASPVDWDSPAVVWAWMFPVFEHWEAGDIRGAASELDKVEPLISNGHFQLGINVSSFQLMLGRGRAAAAAANAISRPDTRALVRATVAFHTGDSATLRQAIPELAPAAIRVLSESGETSRTVWVLTQLGRGRDVKRILDAAGSKLPASVQMSAAYLQPLNDRQIADFRAVMPRAGGDINAPGYRAAELLASALITKGRTRDAAEMLQEVLDTKRAALPYIPMGLYWMRLQLLLAKLYRAQGRLPEANSLEDDLARLLVAADSDFPLARELKRTIAGKSTSVSIP